MCSLSASQHGTFPPVLLLRHRLKRSSDTNNTRQSFNSINILTLHQSESGCKKHSSVMTVVSEHERTLPRPASSPLGHDNRLHCYPLTPIGFLFSILFQTQMKAKCYKSQMWVSPLSSCTVLWLHKPPPFSLSSCSSTPKSIFFTENMKRTHWDSATELYLTCTSQLQLEKFGADNVTTDHRLR